MSKIRFRRSLLGDLSNLECDLDAVKGGLMAEYASFYGIAHPIMAARYIWNIREILSHFGTLTLVNFDTI